MMQYLYLKQKALEAVKNKKIFTVQGRNAIAVRKALLYRGWVEKRSPYQWNTEDSQVSMKLSSSDKRENVILSSLVEKCTPNLVWGEKNFKTTQDFELPIRNTLKVNRLWSTKARLYTSLQNTSWNYIENVAEVNAPRTYSNTNSDDIREFIYDYYLTACTSLIKLILAKVRMKRPIFKDTGTIPINVFVFAINRCTDYLYKKENFDIDNKEYDQITSEDWNLFLMKYQSIVSGKEVFQIDPNLPTMISYAKRLLKRILKLRPQLRCEGCSNIWIVKPSECFNGRGIILSSKLDKVLDVVTNSRKECIIQKYIEAPLLVYERKFDIRQYFLITNTHPLKIWMYQDCVIKFCSQKYSLKNLHESIHITTQAVQRRYKNSDPHPGLPKNNFCYSNKYRNYLKDTGKGKFWDDVIYPGMKKIIIGIMLSSQEFLMEKNNRFGLYCGDFILDNDFRPWLIEINKTHFYSSNETEICHRVISDIIKVVIDHAQNPEASTGKFVCVYSQPITPSLRTCEYDASALEIKGVRILPHHCNKENRDKETKDMIHNVEDSTRKKCITIPDKRVDKRILERPLLNTIHEMDTLFELANIKIQDNDKHLNVNTDRKKNTFMTQTNLYLLDDSFGL
ncbi:tubulin glycylase 3A-like [Hyposmocoma kahamanoa]|uniref:tubulin glycylase 3A-like n=1 Tax=Hyposmocoma kahamanoa TaxID=1477025 RepID=UPI000E6D62BF|nr:tubulin glycylase 3A-like [Hyposmocoma kahamanoa]